MAKITEKQYQTLKAIELYISVHKFSPTFRELMQIHGLKSTAPVQSRIDGLILAGAVSSSPNSGRTLLVLIPSAEFSKANWVGKWKYYQRQGEFSPCSN